jgi:catechol 1,2-dioxygenase
MRTRLNAIFDDLEEALREIIVKHQVTWQEYRLATGWLTEAGVAGEIADLLDLLVSPAVDDTDHATGEGTASNIEGPVYVADAPMLERPFVLPRREDEPGEKLVFSGTVRSTDGSPLAGAVLDIWQSNGAGEYSHFTAGVPEYNLRGRLTTDDDGCFEFETVVPAPYKVSLAGATRRLFAALGRPCFRPGHIHFKLSHEAAAPLTTQIYFDDDPFIDSDVVGAVKESLVTRLARHDGDEGRPYATCSYDFVLPAARATR